MATFNKATTAFTRPWAYVAFTNEDGEDIIRDSWSVYVSDDEGYQKQHFYSFDDEEQAQAAADHVQAYIDDGGVITDLYWNDIDPSYGSVAYQREGIEQQRAWEERQEDLYGHR